MRRSGITAQSNHISVAMTYINDWEILLDIECLDRGIVPVGISVATPMHDRLASSFASLSDADVRKAKRKYRKCFRKALKWKINQIKQLRPKEVVEDAIRRELQILGIFETKNVKPNITHRYKRRKLVISYLMHKAKLV